MIKVKRFKELQLSNPLYEDTYYCSYDAGQPRVLGHRVFIPKENTTVNLNHAFHSAYKFGTAQVEMNRWAGFKLLIEHGEAAGAEYNWPHIHLLPIPNKEKEETNA
jgi:diadenosine tetraphosphate (Ap4A) HIT family hydrolase